MPVARISSSTVGVAQPGVPTVVFQSDLGDGKEVWSTVTKDLARETRVFSYDRPGYGNSKEVSGVRDACNIAGEQRRLLLEQGLNPPYVLVGHSTGGLYEYVFAKLFPQDVAGLVLVDATHPRYLTRLREEQPTIKRMLDLTYLTAFTDIVKREHDDQERCLDRLDMSTPLKVPARVLVRTEFAAIEAKEVQKLKQQLDEDWLRLTGVRWLDPINGAGRYIQRDKPAAVVQAVESILKEIKSSLAPMAPVAAASDAAMAR